MPLKFYNKVLDKALFIRYTFTCKENHFTGGVFMKEINLQLDELDEIHHLSILYDFYGNLLTERKKKIFEDYVLNDLSLSEIADKMGISRQGVHDIVKRCTKELRDYEESLKLVDKFKSIREKLNQIKDISSSVQESKDLSQLQNIEPIVNEILKEL